MAADQHDIKTIKIKLLPPSSDYDARVVVELMDVYERSATLIDTHARIGDTIDITMKVGGGIRLSELFSKGAS